MYKVGDVVAKFGGLETRWHNYRGEQIIYIDKVENVDDFSFYECMVYLCLDGIWLKGISFNSDDVFYPLDNRVEKCYKSSIRSLFDGNIEEAFK